MLDPCLRGSLSRWGYKYGKLGRTSLGANSVVRQIAKQIFIVQIDNAIKRNHAIIFSDESYINERLGAYMGYAPSENHVSASVPTHAGLGKRLCIVQALDIDGLLIGTHSIFPQADGTFDMPPTGELTPDPNFGAEWLFNAQSDTGDYHR